MNPPRNLGVNLSLSPEELARIEFLARHHGTTRSDLLRWLMKQEERRLRSAVDAR